MLSCCFSRPGRPLGPRPPPPPATRSGPLLLSSKPTPESLTFMDLMPEDWCQQHLHLWFVKSLGWFILLPFGPGFLVGLHFSPHPPCWRAALPWVPPFPQKISPPLTGGGQGVG